MLSAGCPHPTYLKPKVYHGGAKTLFLPVWDSNSFELCFWSGWFLTSSELFRAKICAALVGYVLNEHVLHLRGCEAALKEEELHVLFTFFFCILSNSFKSDAEFCISIDHNFIICYKYPFC